MKIYNVYTDGHHKKGTHQVGYSCIMYEEGVVYSLNECSTQQHFADIIGHDPKSEMLPSNPTMEYFAIMKMVLAYSQVEGHFKIHSDYQGCIGWFTKAWKIKNPMIKLIDNIIREHLIEAKATFEIIKVKAHSGILRNEIADFLTKSKVRRPLQLEVVGPTDLEFNNLVKLIKKWGK